MEHEKTMEVMVTKTLLVVSSSSVFLIYLYMEANHIALEVKLALFPVLTITVRTERGQRNECCAAHCVYGSINVVVYFMFMCGIQPVFFF